MTISLAAFFRLLIAITASLLALRCDAAEVALDVHYTTAPFDSPEAALAAFHQHRFAPLPPALSRIGWADRPVWLVITPQADWASIERPLLEIQPLPVATFEAWAVDPASGGLNPLGRSGIMVPANASPDPQTSLATLPLPQLQGQQMLLSRVQPVGVSVVHPVARDANSHATHAYLAGLAAGAMIFFLGTHLAISVSIYRLVKMPEGLYWTVLMLAICTLLAALNGVLPIKLTEIPPQALGWLLAIIAVVVIVMLSKLILPILQVRHNLPRLHACVNYALWGFVPAIGLGVATTGSALAGVLAWHFIHIFLMILTGWVRWPGVIAEVRPLLIMGLLLVLAMEWLYAGLLGLIPLSWAAHITWQIAMVAVMVMSLVELLKGNFSERRYVRAERERLHGLLLQEKQQLALRVEERTAELRAALSEVQRFESHQRELLSLASHEFRTPAAIIKSSLEVVDCLPESISSEAEPYMESVRVASGRLIFLANKLIEHDRWRELSIKPRMIRLELRAWTQEVLGDVPKSHKVVTLLGEAPIAMDADTVLLRIALQNLIDNALSHNARSGCVTVHLQADQTQARLIVDDNGKGISDANKPQVFERFFSERNGQSHGLGLSIVRAVARLHGGEATVADAPSGGARFVISLPRPRLHP